MSRELTRRQNNESTLIDVEKMKASISQSKGNGGVEESPHHRVRRGLVGGKEKVDLQQRKLEKEEE